MSKSEEEDAGNGEKVHVTSAPRVETASRGGPPPEAFESPKPSSLLVEIHKVSFFVVLIFNIMHSNFLPQMMSEAHTTLKDTKQMLKD